MLSAPFPECTLATLLHGLEGPPLPHLRTASPGSYVHMNVLLMLPCLILASFMVHFCKVLCQAWGHTRQDRHTVPHNWIVGMGFEFAALLPSLCVLLDFVYVCQLA